MSTRTLVTYICEKCFKPFVRATKPGGYRFCGHNCANQHALKLGREELLPFAEIGARAGYMAKRLEVSARTVRNALIKHELFRLWSSRRYKKCAHQNLAGAGIGNATQRGVEQMESFRSGCLAVGSSTRT